MPPSSALLAAGGIPQPSSNPDPGTRANLNYLDQLARYHKQHGTNLNRFPSVDKRPLDLFRLKKAVEIRGGFEQVCKTKKWAEIGRDLGYSGKIMSSLSTSLKNSYQRWLQPYEEYLRVAKPGVQQQLEIEHGGPYTPPPNHSPMQKNPTPFENEKRSATPHGQTNLPTPSVLNTPQEATTPAKTQTPPVDPIPSRPIASGFTPVNAGGFTAVNKSPSFMAVNSTAALKPDPENEVPTPKSVSEYQKDSTPVSNGHSTKRAISTESGDQAEGDLDENGRRSKRLRKGMPRNQLLEITLLIICGRCTAPNRRRLADESSSTRSRTL